MVHNIGNKMNEKFGLSNDKNEENTDSIKVVCKRDTVSDRIKADFKFKKRTKAVAVVVLLLFSLVQIHNITENLFGDTGLFHKCTVDIGTFEPMQGYENFFLLSTINISFEGDYTIYASAEDAKNLVNGLVMNFGDIYFADLYNNDTNEWMDIDSSGFNINDFQKFIENGDYSVAYTNDADFIGMSGEELANAGMITGFINTADYIDMIYKSLDYRKKFVV